MAILVGTQNQPAVFHPTFNWLTQDTVRQDRPVFFNVGASGQITLAQDDAKIRISQLPGAVVAGDANRFVKVNAAGTGLEYVAGGADNPVEFYSEVTNSLRFSAGDLIGSTSGTALTTIGSADSRVTISQTARTTRVMATAVFSTPSTADSQDGIDIIATKVTSFTDIQSTRNIVLPTTFTTGDLLPVGTAVLRNGSQYHACPAFLYKPPTGNPRIRIPHGQGAFNDLRYVSFDVTIPTV
jgi:hypothetical protein